MPQKSTSALFLLLAFLTAAVSACAPSPQAIVAPAALNAAATKTAQGALATVVAGTLQAQPTVTPLPSPTLTPTEVPTATFAPTSVSGQPDLGVLQARPHYKLDVEFNFADRAGKVSEEIRYTNRSGDVIPDLRLMVELFIYKDMFSLTDLRWDDGQPVENAGWENIQVHFPLRQPLAPGESVGLKLTYQFRLPAQSSLGGERPLPIGYTSRQANLVDWYPFIPPYRSGQGWLAHPPAYYGEHLVYDLSDFEVNLRIVGSRQGLLIAASAPAKEDGDWLRYVHLAARNFAFSIGSDYKTATAQAGKVTVTSYYFSMSEKAGKGALQTTVDAVKLYEELFGPYPHDTLAVVEADFLDGMEYDGLFFLSRAFYNIYGGKAEDYLVAIAAHETAHQWFYGVVGSDQANEPWMDEALSTYCERLYYERYSPNSLKWWWFYRVDYYSPHGMVDTSVYNPQGTLQTYQDYRNAVYLNGAHFIEDLRKAIGDEAFFAFLKDYTTKFAGQIALSRDFFALLAEHTQVDLTAVLSKYFQNHP